MAKNDYKNVEKVKELLGDQQLGGLRKRLSSTEKSLNDILKKLTALETQKAERKAAEAAAMEAAAAEAAAKEAEKAAISITIPNLAIRYVIAKILLFSFNYAKNPPFFQ